MDQDKAIEKLSELIEDLGWDYDRMSSSGQETYEQICSLLVLLKGE